MTKKFKQLLWLGVGTATEPQGLIEQAESSVLVEAREDAFKQLASKFSNSNNVVLRHHVVDTQSSEVVFYQYNLPEYSAVHQATGLTQLFPGLKLTQQDTVTSKGIAELVDEAKITGENNLLLIDIADISLSLLKQLGAEQRLHYFCQIMFVSSSVALYQDAANSIELSNFMQSHGFTLVEEDASDPDLPLFTFVCNPLWRKVKQQEQREADLTRQLYTQHRQLAEQAMQKEKYVAEQKKQLDTQSQQFAQQAKLAEQREAELKKQLDAQNQQLTQQAKLAEQREAELKKQLDAQNQQLTQQAKLAEQREAELKKQLDAQSQQLIQQAKRAEQHDAELKKQLEILNQQLVKQGQQTEQMRQEQALVTKSNKDLHEQLSAVKVAAEKQQAEFTACLSGKDAELSALSEQRNKDRSAFTILTEQHDKLKVGLDKAQAALQAKEQDLTKQQAEHLSQLAKLKTELEQVAKHAAQRLDKISQLEKANRQLNETNDQLAKRQRALEQEMLKAEAQIDIIKELVLR